MMRLPHQENNPEGLDACFVGIPIDLGSPSRSGHRHGPRDIRQESTMLRPCNITGAMPFESLNVADIGDVPVDFLDIYKSMETITGYYENILKADCVPLTLGGDHSLSLPILRAMKAKYGPVGIIQVDAHPDFHDEIFGEKFANGTTFRRALEEGLVSPKHMVQIGLRGSVLFKEYEQSFKWGRNQVCVCVCVCICVCPSHVCPSHVCPSHVCVYVQAVLFCVCPVVRTALDTFAT